MTQPPTRRLATEAYVGSATAAAISDAIEAMGASGVTSEIAPISINNLAASGTYTQPWQDLGATMKDRATRLRVAVMHLAGLNPGNLRLETSTDSTNPREIWRNPIPSDGLYHTFTMPLFHRYWRLVFVNGATAQTQMWLSAVLTAGEALGDLDTSLTFLHSAANGSTLGASATITGPTLDLGGNNRWDKCRFYANATQASTLNVEQSMDGTNWNTVSSPAVAANAHVLVEMLIAMRYIRYRLVNTVATAGTYRSSMTLISV